MPTAISLQTNTNHTVYVNTAITANTFLTLNTANTAFTADIQINNVFNNKICKQSFSILGGSNTTLKYSIGKSVTYSLTLMRLIDPCSDGAFEYEYSMASDGSALPSIMSFNPSTGKFTVNTESEADIGNYVVLIRGYLPSG
jgi:hypothetical protein